MVVTDERPGKGDGWRRRGVRPERRVEVGSERGM